MTYKRFFDFTNSQMVSGGKKSGKRRSGLCALGGPLLMWARPYFGYVLVVGCFIFVLLANRQPREPNAKRIEHVPWEATDFVVANGSADLLTAIRRVPPELQTHLSSKSRRGELPIIVYWNAYFVNEYKMFVPKDREIDCPYRCIHTDDHSLGNRAAVRVHHERTFDPSDLPPANPLAFNVLHTLEPPFFTFSIYDKQHKPPVGYFNVTSSYRSKSAVWYPYDRFVKRNGRESAAEIWTDEQAKVAAKQKPLIIAVSNCNSHSAREEYVRELRKHLNVTIVGRCSGSTVQCETDGGGRALHYDPACMEKLNDRHFFYLSFENSVCPEYTSEKFWRLKQLIVPIVLSRGVMGRHIPNDSYIAASDFESPKQLTDYLKHLMDNRKEYAKYFAWTKNFRRTHLRESEVRVACQLCKLAYSRQPMRITNYKTYWDVNECPRHYARGLVNNPKAVAKWERQFAEIMSRTYRERKIEELL